MLLKIYGKGVHFVFLLLGFMGRNGRILQMYC